MLEPVRTSPPATMPLTADEAAGAKAQARVSTADEDALFDAYIGAATEYLDGWPGMLGRCLITQTWRQDFDRFWDKLRLPLGPVQSISGVTYYDNANVSQTLATSVYVLRTDALGPYVALKPDQSWPSVYSRVDAVSVTFVAGYGAATDVPQPIRQAIRLAATSMFENRSDGGIPPAAMSMVAGFRRMSV